MDNWPRLGAVTSLAAGTPCIIKRENGTQRSESNLVFTDIVISKTTVYFKSTDGNVQFRGTYALISFDVEGY